LREGGGARFTTPNPPTLEAAADNILGSKSEVCKVSWLF
jgi:hypothetical protein